AVSPALPPFPTRRSSDLEVGHLGAHQLGPAPVVGAAEQVRLSTLGEGDEVLGVRSAQARLVAGFLEALGGVLAHGLEQTVAGLRSEEHTSELQSRENLVC